MSKSSTEGEWKGELGSDVLDHTYTMAMPCGLWGWWLYTPDLEPSWFLGAVSLMP